MRRARPRCGPRCLPVGRKGGLTADHTLREATKVEPHENCIATRTPSLAPTEDNDGAGGPKWRETYSRDMAVEADQGGRWIYAGRWTQARTEGEMDPGEDREVDLGWEMN